MSKEHNFISAVVYFNGDADTAIRGANFARTV